MKRIVFLFFQDITLYVLFLQEQTEWQLYLRHCIEIIAKVAEFAPLEMYELVVSYFIIGFQ
jgi:hypothetical protein